MAPQPLLALARQAAADEVRHSAVTAELARKYGGTPQPPVVVARPVRSLPEIAAENEVEGCVRETYAALLATYQAAHARDPPDRRRPAGHCRRRDAPRRPLAARRRLGQRTAQPRRKDELRSLRQRAIATLRTELAAPLPPPSASPGTPQPAGSASPPARTGTRALGPARLRRCLQIKGCQEARKAGAAADLTFSTPRRKGRPRPRGPSLNAAKKPVRLGPQRISLFSTPRRKGGRVRGAPAVSHSR